MWNKRDDDRTPQRPGATPASAPEPYRAPQPAAPAASTPSYTAQAGTPGGTAIIGPSVVIRGDIIAQEDLYINGQVEGTLQLEKHRLAVGPRGKVKSQIVAREVLIQGAVQGDIQASEKIIIKNEGTLVGDIQVAGIVIEDGAYFKGSIDIIRPAAQPAPQQQPAQKSQPAQPKNTEAKVGNA